jgi:four helix bundle protein
MSSDELSERFLELAVRVIKLCRKLEKTAIGKHTSDQLFRSGTSSGANYEEARGAESKRDFLHKLQVVLKELKESMFWLKVIKRAGLLSHADPDLIFLLNENEQLVRIIAKSVVTAKNS